MHPCFRPQNHIHWMFEKVLYHNIKHRDKITSKLVRTCPAMRCHMIFNRLLVGVVLYAGKKMFSPQRAFLCKILYDLC